MKRPRRVTLELTRLELEVLWTAALSIRDDLEDYGVTGADARAYERALRKIANAGREETGR